MYAQHPRQLTLPHLARTGLGPVAAGTDWSGSPGTRTFWELISVHLVFVADANAANRYTRLEFGPLLQPDFSAIVVPALTANLTYQIWFGRGMGFTSTTFSNNRISIPLPTGLIIASSDQIRTVTDNMQVGDQFTNVRLRYFQWQDVVH